MCAGDVCSTRVSEGQSKCLFRLVGGQSVPVVCWTRDLSSLGCLSVLFMRGACNDKGNNLLAASPSLLLVYYAAGIIKRESVPTVTHSCPVYSSVS